MSSLHVPEDQEFTISILWICLCNSITCSMCGLHVEV